MSRLVIVGALLLSFLTTFGVSSAQELNPAFSDEVISTLGLPAVEVVVSPDGVDAPAELPAGLNLITLSAGEPFVGYLNIVQYPAELDEATAIEQMLAAGAGDMPQAGWTYFGGTNTGNIGEPSTFAIDLAPGDYYWAASYYGTEQGSEEVMSLVPFTVTEAAADATPVTAIEASVTLEMTDDLAYLLTPETVPTGPQIWEIANTGEHHVHHVVMFSIPEGTTKQDIIPEFNAMFAGTPTAGEPLMAQFVWVGYAAIQSGGQTTWSEFNIDPGNYAVICFIMDPETGRPHMLDGMVTTFTVE